MQHDEAIPRHTEPGASPEMGVASVAAGSSRPLDEDDDIESAVRRGELRVALTRIDERFGAALYRFVRNLMGADDVSDDVYQTVLIEAYRDLETFSGRSSLRTWLFSIARHRCLDALKADRRRAARFESTDELPEVADVRPGPDGRMSDEQVLSALARCLDELPPELRMVLLLRFQEGFGYDDIARITRLRNETLRARVSRAMPALRTCIERQGAL
jgi:RNA polymerase sigma-70 factor (ECF subfamily)